MITLKNDGHLEIDLIKTMGVNVKESDSPIGYFGTGLKYAIAVFVRENIPITLYIGENKYSFLSEKKVIRGKEFDFCVMKGEFDFERLAFTTDLGKNWEPWQAYREIHSNCLDEGGTIKLEPAKPEDGSTQFFIEHNFDVDSIFLNKGAKKLIFENDEIEIYEGESDYIFYKGIRAKDLSRKSVYTYNIKRYCQLTEDRSISYSTNNLELIYYE